MPRDPKKNVVNVAHLRERRRRALVAQAGGSCIVCGYNRCERALVFHHRDPSEKRFALSRTGMTHTPAEIAAEVAKCDLLCANCHAEVHEAERLGLEPSQLYALSG